MKRLMTLVLVLLSMISTAAFAQERAYTDGPVTVVTSVRVAPGQDDRYIGYLQSSWKKEMEAQKEAGIILSYSVQAIVPRSVDDPNLYLVVTYPNMASFDGLDDRTDAIAAKVLGQNREQGSQAYADRSSMRTILGSQMMRAIVLK
jgi:hypothetical protein